LRRHIAAADKIGREIIKHIEKEKKDDPEFAAKMAAIDKLVGR